MQPWIFDRHINVFTHPIKYVFRLNKNNPYLSDHHRYEDDKGGMGHALIVTVSALPYTSQVDEACITRSLNRCEPMP